MKKTLDIYTIEAVNIVSFYNQLTEDQAKELGVKIRWALKKAVSKIAPDVREFEEFRDKEVKVLQDNYFTDEKSDEIMRTKVDENGNPILDDNGAEVTELVRKVKDEYIDEYQNAVQELNKRLEEILAEKNTYEFEGVNMDNFVANLPDDTSLDFNTLEMIDAILGVNGEE